MPVALAGQPWRLSVRTFPPPAASTTSKKAKPCWAEPTGGGRFGNPRWGYVGRNYNIPVMKSALSGSAEWAKTNVKAVTGATAVAGGAFAIKDGVDRLGEGGNKWLAGAEIAGGVVGTLGGAELGARNFNIPVLNQALTGPVKYMFTSKGGITVSGGTVAAAGLGAAADGVRRLTTEKGIVNDGILAWLNLPQAWPE